MICIILKIDAYRANAELPDSGRYLLPNRSIDNNIEQRPGFGVLKTAHATIYFQKGLSSQRVTEIGSAFEKAYKIIGRDLAFPAVRPRIYAYQSMNDLSNDLVDYWGYPEWIRTYRVIPRMNSNYEMWVPPDRGADFIGHEYCHRIIEQIAGVNSQVKYKWFDEGLATEEGVRTLSSISPAKAAAVRNYYRHETKKAKLAGSYIPLSKLTTEAQWQYWIKGPRVFYIYYQTAAAMEYLVSQSGMRAIKSVLIQIKQGKPFSSAFRTGIGKSIDQFESEFLAWLSTSQ